MLLAKLNVELTQIAARPARLQRGVEKMDMFAKLKGEQGYLQQ
jgi:hypothetical protein